MYEYYVMSNQTIYFVNRFKLYYRSSMRQIYFRQLFSKKPLSLELVGTHTHTHTNTYVNSIYMRIWNEFIVHV